MISEHITGRVHSAHLMSIIVWRENIIYPKSIFPALQLFMSCRFIMCNCTNALTRPLTSAGSLYVPAETLLVLEWPQCIPREKSISTQIDGKPAKHLCSCLSKKELRQTDKNSDKMCQPPTESLREKDMGGMGEKLRAGRMDDTICLCLPTTVVYWCADCE